MLSSVVTVISNSPKLFPSWKDQLWFATCYLSWRGTHMALSWELMRSPAPNYLTLKNPICFGLRDQLVIPLDLFSLSITCLHEWQLNKYPLRSQVAETQVLSEAKCHWSGSCFTKTSGGAWYSIQVFSYPGWKECMASSCSSLPGSSIYSQKNKEVVESLPM